MEILILVVVLVLVAAGLVGTVAVRRRHRGVELEPPPSAERTKEAAPPVTPEVPADGDVAVDDPLVAEVEEALEAAAAPDVVDEVEAPPRELEPLERPRFRDRLGKARGLLSGYVSSVLQRGHIDDETWDELEEALLRADVGVDTTMSLLDAVRSAVKEEGLSEPDAVMSRLKDEIVNLLAVSDRGLRVDAGETNVWLFVGVNGVGKTTTIGKVGRRQLDEGRTVVMAAGDTFRAAAAEQLSTWAERVGADIVQGAEGADPSSVVFDAVQRAAAHDAELVLADTAGRLHTKVNLMEELAKVRRVADRDPGHVTEVLLVIDATTGQNGLAQARQFAEATDVTGVVLTKLDGTAKGGIAIAIQTELGIPVKLVGLGEAVGDLIDFDPQEYVDALFS